MFSQQVKEILPDEYDEISRFAQVLPLDGSVPADPFTGFIVNFNVTTKIHRDWNDLYFCLVLVFSEECEGGDLCFMEPGIRLGLRNGDLVLFRSSELSHFNLHFKGRRASIVFHSDSAGRDWVTNRNGWEGSMYMNVMHS